MLIGTLGTKASGHTFSFSLRSTYHPHELIVITLIKTNMLACDSILHCSNNLEGNHKQSFA